MGVLGAASASVYQYLNFDKITDYSDVAEKVSA
jgi:aconitate hydratase 2/2-methylisocitrate dehydratase